MKSQLLNKEVLAMYDVRGIQDYIFRINKVREIIGASKIVEDILADSLAQIIKTMQVNNEITGIVKLNWQNNDFEFDNNKNIDVEVGFIGGGNAYVLYRKGEICELVNRRLAKKILEETYSLNLAVAVVEKTNDYKFDYNFIQKEMQRIKAKMPMVRTVGSFPVTRSDIQTGFPIVKKVKNERLEKEEFLCKESILKRNAPVEKNDNVFDDMVTQKGTSSMLAIVHIDGNNMGKRIAEVMSQTHDYKKAIDKMREISKNINNGFKDTYEKMEEGLEKAINSGNTFIKNKKYIRKIITAGDDITFVCNGKIALSLVEYFLQDISKKVMYGHKENKNDLNKYGFSACAGIAYMYSHFPFSDAYKVAEECCSNAKARAKQKENIKEGFIGNWVDFQICKHISTINLERNREKNYIVKDGYSLIKRPYNIGCENCNIEKYSFKNFKENIKYFLDEKKIPRSWAKRIRNVYPLGENEIQKVIEEAKSRGKYLPNSKQAFENKEASFYDALEIMDLFEDIDMKGGEGNE